MHVAHGSHNVSEANRRTHNVHDRPLAGWILHDGRLVEQYDCRCRSQSNLPLANDTLSLCVAPGLRRPEFAECPAIKVEHSDERTGIVSSPCGIESDEQRGHGLGLLLLAPRSAPPFESKNSNNKKARRLAACLVSLAVSILSDKAA